MDDEKIIAKLKRLSESGRDQATVTYFRYQTHSIYRKLDKSPLTNGYFLLMIAGAGILLNIVFGLALGAATGEGRQFISNILIMAGAYAVTFICVVLMRVIKRISTVEDMAR